jgi:hypothetical protein
MKIKRLPRTTEFIYLEKELQCVGSGTAPLISTYCNSSALVLVVLSVLSFSRSRSCSLSLRSSVLVSQCSVRKHERRSGGI